MKVRFPLLPRWIRWAVAVSIAAFIFYVSVVTVPPETAVDTTRPELVPLDKWRHFLAYAALGGAVAYGLEGRETKPRYLALTVVAFTIVYGVSIEFSQSILPQRYFSLGDAYANAIGAMLSLTWYGIRRYLCFIPFKAMLSGNDDVTAR